MFGIYARNYIAGQGRYQPDNQPLHPPMPTYEAHINTLHIARQACPGSCRADVCRNSYCQAHPNFERNPNDPE